MEEEMQEEPSLASQSAPTYSNGPPLVHVQYFDCAHAQGIYQLIEAYMLSLQPGPSGKDIKQQVEAAIGKTNDDCTTDTSAMEGGVADTSAADEGMATAVTEGGVVSGSAAKGDRIAAEGGVAGSVGDVTMENGDDEEEVDAVGQVEYYVGYCIDRFPMSYKPEEILIDRIYTEPFWVEKFVEKEEQRLRRMAIKCFNCGGDHHMNHCTKPLDFQRVREESRTYKDSLGIPGADKRYHMQPEDRFAKFKPGVLSPQLREALGIGPDDNPPFATRLCIIGYPVAWKRWAEEQALALYHEPDEPIKPIIKDIVFPGFNDVVKSPDEISLSDEEEEEERMEGVEGAENGEGLSGEQSRGGVDGRVEENGRVSEAKEDDLGTLSDYELEEVDGDDGEMIIGFRVKKSSDSPEPPPLEPIPNEKKKFSLDFPPGLVDLEHQLLPTDQWKLIKKILGH